MQKVLTAAEMREVDRLTTEKYGIPSLLLMENAAHAAARVITEKLGGSVKGKSILVLCGKGNNGGDGVALARVLWTQGANVTICLMYPDDEFQGDAKQNLGVLRNMHAGQRPFRDPTICIAEVGTHRSFFDRPDPYFGPDVVVDALFGTGLSRPLTDDHSILAKLYKSLLNEADRPVFLSIDLPSGIDADKPDLIGECFSADITVTFTSPKPASVLPPSSNFNGELVIANIGSPPELVENQPSKLFLTEQDDAKKWLERTGFSDDSYKNKRGHALLIAGSADYSGAAVLCGNAAIRSGVGLVTIATPKSSKDSIASRVLPEVMVRGVAETESGAISEDALGEIEELSEKIDAIAIGSGLSSNEESTKNFVRKVIENRTTPVVIDADGLNLLSPFATSTVIVQKPTRSKGEKSGGDKSEFLLILTPHEGEFIRLLGTADKDTLKDRVAVVREFAQKHNVILVLKGERALIAEPTGKVVVNPTGNSGLGKAGNGDTLTGIIVGFIAQAVKMNVDIFETVVAAVYIAGLAGDIAEKKYGKRVMTASDVRECLTEAFTEVQR